jgi:hypothetical protein
MIAPRTRGLLLMSGICAAIGGCASTEDFPSLAPRPAELADAPAPPAPPPPPATVDAAVAARIVPLTAAANEGQSEFDAELRAAQSAVGGAGSPGSESWIEAQQAISRVEGARSKTMTALAELDALARERSVLPNADADLAAIAAASAEVEQLAQAQRQAIDKLIAALPEA